MYQTEEKQFCFVLLSKEAKILEIVEFGTLKTFPFTKLVQVRKDDNSLEWLERRYVQIIGED